MQTAMPRTPAQARFEKLKQLKERARNEQKPQQPTDENTADLMLKFERIKQAVEIVRGEVKSSKS